jgi:GINS complex subunit 4
LSKRERKQEGYIACLYQMEMERLKYVLSSYIRTRLAKLERYWLYYYHFDEKRSIMSDSEIRYLNEYVRIRVTSLRESVLNHLEVNDFPMNDVEGGPSRMKHVICRVLEDLGQVQLDPSYKKSKSSNNIL